MSGTVAVAAERLQVGVRRVEGAPVVGIRAWILGGARTESVPGQSLVTGRLLTEGTRRRSWREIADDAERLGMDLGSGANFEQHELGIDALADDWERALDWVAELVLEPIFPEDRCVFTRRQVAAELESLADRPEVRTAWAFLEQLYTPHPRSRPVQGDPESLASLSPQACTEHHARGLGLGLIVAVAGRIDETAAEKRVSELFASRREPALAIPEPPAPRGFSEARREVLLPPGEAESDQAHLLMGHLTLARNHPDYDALELAGVVLGAGSGLAGRIPERIREREGLAYSVRAQTVAGCGLDPGRLLIYVGTSTNRVEQAERGVEEEVARLVEDGITEREMEDARSFLLGREPFQRETARQWADLLAEAALLGIPLDEPGWRAERLRSLTREQVEDALRRHIHPEALKVTVGVRKQG